MDERSQLLRQFWAFLEQEGIRYCVVGDSSRLPDHISSDIDIVVPEFVRANLEVVIRRFCALTNTRVVQLLEHEQTALYFVIAWISTEGVPTFLALDFCSDYYRYGQYFLSESHFLDHRTFSIDKAEDSRGFYVPEPSVEYVYYLLKKIDKEQLDSEHGEHLCARWKEDPNGARRWVERFWPDEKHNKIISEASENGNWESARDRLTELRHALRRQTQTQVGSKRREWKRRLRRIRRPTGFLLSVLGPDGSGKSTIIKNLQADWGPAFRRTVSMHLRPRILHADRSPECDGNNTSVDEPYARPSRNGITSLAKLCYFVVDYWMGYAGLVRPMLIRSTLVIFDRYFDDLYIDPKRYRYGAPLWIARMCRRMIFSPDRWLILDAPPDVLQERKKEVTYRESAHQQRGYRAFSRFRECSYLVDTSGPEQQVRKHVNRLMLEWLADRCENHMRLETERKLKNPSSAKILLWACRNDVPVVSRLIRVIFNCDIYCNFSCSVMIPHPYGIVIHSGARIGRLVTIMQHVTIAEKGWDNSAPTIEDEVYIGVGATVLGGIRIGRGSVIGANSVVTRDVPPFSTVIGANRVLDTYGIYDADVEK